MGDVAYRTLMFRLIRAASFAAEDRYGSETMGRRDDAERAVTTYVDSLRAENARLRAALLRLADDDSDEAYAARAALDAKDGE